MRKVARITLAIILVSLIILIAFTLWLPHAKELVFLRLANNQGQTIYVLGTIHGSHLSFTPYSLWHLQAVVERLHPDLLLVESRPEELGRDNWGDGPIEMLFASLTARSLGIEVQGIDWWNKSSLHDDSSEREDQMFQNILGHLPGSRTVLILAGWSHIEGLKQRLQSAGYKVEAFSSREKQALFAPSDKELLFPPGMTYYLQKRIELDQANLQNETDGEWRGRIESGIALRQELLAMIAEVGEQPSR